MFRNWKCSAIFAGWMQPFEDAPDAGSGGGGADTGDAVDGSQPSAEGVDGEAGVEAAAEGDDANREDAIEDLLDDDDDDQRPIEERFQALRKKSRKQKRQLAKLLPLKQRLNGVDLDDLVLSKRQYEQLSAQIRDNPRLRSFFSGDAEPEQGRRTPVAETEKEEQFDIKSLPFDPDENDTNKYFAGVARDLFETRKLLKQLQGRLDTGDQRETQRTAAQERATWRSTIEAAAKFIQDDGVRDLFKDNLAHAYMSADVRKKYTVQQLVSHYLRRLKVDPAQAQQATRAAAKAGTTAPVRTAATQQRIAEHNKTLPRTSAVTGNPAPARNQRPTLASIRKQIRATAG